MFRYTSSVDLAALTMVLFAWRRISRSVVNLSFSVTIKSVSIGLLSFSCLVTLLMTRPSEELDIINRRHVITATKTTREMARAKTWKREDEEDMVERHWEGESFSAFTHMVTVKINGFIEVFYSADDARMIQVKNHVYTHRVESSTRESIVAHKPGFYGL